MIRELGSDLRFPGVPAPNRKAPIDAAMPKQTVATSHGMNCQEDGHEQGVALRELNILRHLFSLTSVHQL